MARVVPAALMLLAACSSSSSPSTASDAGGCTTLTIYNLNSGCEVSIQGYGTPSNAAKISVCFAPGTEFTLDVSAASSAFELGPDPWVGTNTTVLTEDSGSSSPTASAGTGVGTTPGCILVCCPMKGTACETQSGYTAWLANCQQ
jgi:hypothetical protein